MYELIVWKYFETFELCRKWIATPHSTISASPKKGGRKGEYCIIHFLYSTSTSKLDVCFNKKIAGAPTHRMMSTALFSCGAHQKIGVLNQNGERMARFVDFTEEAFRQRNGSLEDIKTWEQRFLLIICYNHITSGREIDIWQQLWLPKMHTIRIQSLFTILYWKGWWLKFNSVL